MVALFHYVHLRAFAHETEDPARVLAAVRTAAQDPAARVEETHAEGGHGNKVLILDGEVKSGPAAKRLFAQLAHDDPRGFEHIVATARERVDENLNLYFRLDKQDAYLGRLALASDDDAITVRGKIRSFESKRSGHAQADALASLDEFLSGVARLRQTVGQ